MNHIRSELHRRQDQLACNAITITAITLRLRLPLTLLLLHSRSYDCKTIRGRGQVSLTRTGIQHVSATCRNSNLNMWLAVNACLPQISNHNTDVYVAA
jgi:hypothetical protein